MVGEGGVDPSFERVEVEQLGREGGRERLFAGRLARRPQVSWIEDMRAAAANRTDKMTSPR